MIDGSDLASLETAVRDLIGEETARLWTQAAIFRHINAEMQRLARRAIGLEQGWFESSYTATLTSATVALPNNCYRIRNLEIYDSSLWRPLRWIGPESRYLYQNTTSSTTEALAVRFSGTDLVIENGLGTATQLRIQYARVPAAMRYEVMTTGDEAGHDTFTMGSTASILNDIYNGDRIVTLSGTGSGQFCTITDYVGSTKVATVTPVWTSAVDTDTYYSTVLPAPLDQFSDMVVMGSAIRCLSRRRDSELISRLTEQYAVDLQAFDGDLGPRQSDQGGRVTYYPMYESDG